MSGGLANSGFGAGSAMLPDDDRPLAASEVEALVATRARRAEVDEIARRLTAAEVAIAELKEFLGE